MPRLFGLNIKENNDMDTPTFQKLSYGNIVSEAGRKLLVSHTLKDLQDNTLAIGVIEAFESTDAAGLTLVSSASSRTFITASSDGKLVLMGETIQPSVGKKK